MDIDDLNNCFSVLGLAPGASLDQVKDAYKNSLQAFHPDKFAAGSSSQKWASDRLILVKDAYEKLQEFFANNPTGEPLGGWQGAKNDTGSQDGSMDWQAWETEQHGSFAEEVRAWEERQKAKDGVKLDEHGKIRRSKTLAFTKMALAGILACLWLGKCTNNQWENAKRAQEAADWKARWEYQIQTGGTSSGPYSVDPQTLAQQGNEEAKRMTDRWTAEDNERNMGLFFLWVITGAGAWLWFARRPKAVFSNWVESGKFDTAELKAAAKEAALQAKAKAEVAAKKAVETAEKLKAEAAKRMEERPINVPLDSFGSTKTPGKPTAEEIIAAAAKAREQAEAQLNQAKAKPQEPQGTEEMLDELLKSEAKSKAKRSRKKKSDTE